MELTIKKSDFAQLLGVTSDVAQRKTTMPILVNVLLSANKGSLLASATDLEVTAISKAKADVTKSGTTAVNAKMLSDIVRELPDNSDVRLRLLEGQRLEVSCGNTNLQVIGVSPEEYPALPGINIKTTSAISGAMLLEMINKTIYSVCTDESRFNLCGIYVELEKIEGDKFIRFTSTDNHRITTIARQLDMAKLDEKVIIPRKGLNEIKKLLDTGDDTIRIAVEEGFFVVENKASKISVRLIDGSFPDCKGSMPQAKGDSLRVNSKELADALRRVSLLVNEPSKGVRFDIDKDALTISSSSPEFGHGRERIEATFSGKSMAVGFSAKYILDFVNSLEEPQNLNISLFGTEGPGMFQSDSDSSYMTLIMPFRLDY